jgi:DNA-3-methyladenine glycosylase
MPDNKIPDTRSLTPMKFHPLPRSFYEPGAAGVAMELLGHWLIHRTPQGVAGGVIVETEAYVIGDPASHFYTGITPRNRVIWGEPGFSYVYFIYGMHYCFNTVCHPAGSAEAVLVRAIEPTFGRDVIVNNRATAHPRNLTNGPARLCAALGIDKSCDGLDLCAPGAALTVARNPEVARTRDELGPVVTTTRIGINKAADWPLRFYLSGSRFVSRR